MIEKLKYCYENNVLIGKLMENGDIDEKEFLIYMYDNGYKKDESIKNDKDFIKYLDDLRVKTANMIFEKYNLSFATFMIFNIFEELEDIKEC